MNTYIIFVILQLNVEVVTMDTVLLLTTACKYIFFFKKMKNMYFFIMTFVLIGALMAGLV